MGGLRLPPVRIGFRGGRAEVGTEAFPGTRPSARQAESDRSAAGHGHRFIRPPTQEGIRCKCDRNATDQTVQLVPRPACRTDRQHIIASYRQGRSRKHARRRVHPVEGGALMPSREPRRPSYRTSAPRWRSTDDTRVVWFGGIDRDGLAALEVERDRTAAQVLAAAEKARLRADDENRWLRELVDALARRADGPAGSSAPRRA